MKKDIFLNPYFLITLSILVLNFKASAQNEADKILGVWKTEPTNGDYAHIEIYKNSDKYNGKIVWLSSPLKDGKPKIDDKNPEKNKQNKPLLGLDLLSGFQYDGKENWENGTIYDPSNGNTYKCYMWLENTNNLKVKGYIGFSLIGRSTTWQRVK